jgi:Isocitrate/isopropylmalate dehydrogenase
VQLENAPIRFQPSEAPPFLFFRLFSFPLKKISEFLLSRPARGVYTILWLSESCEKGMYAWRLSPSPSHSLAATDKVWRGVHRKLCVTSFPNIYYRSFPSFQVTLIPGDGIGQEITESVKDIFESVNAPIEWEQYDVSGMSSSGEALFKQAMESLKRNKVGLKGLSFIHSFIPWFHSI